MHDPVFFFFNDTATTEIYTLSLHDALPIWGQLAGQRRVDRVELRLGAGQIPGRERQDTVVPGEPPRSEEHTSELQSRRDLVCRLLLEKKKTIPNQCKPAETPTEPHKSKTPP